MQIYISKNGKQFGPYTRTQLYSYVQSGTFAGTDPAWWDETLGWKSIDDMTFSVDSITASVDRPTLPIPEATSPFPKQEFKDTKIRKVQIVKPGQMKDSSDLPWSVRVERYFDRHNHKMEFMRTFIGLLTITLQLVILAKIFGYM
jgi:hypothetical protein